MSKGTVKAVIYLLLWNGYKPKDIIKLGYKTNTVYLYNKRFKLAKEEYFKIATGVR